MHDDAINLLDAPKAVVVVVEGVESGGDEVVAVVEVVVPRVNEVGPVDSEAEESGKANQGAVVHVEDGGLGKRHWRTSPNQGNKSEGEKTTTQL